MTPESIIKFINDNIIWSNALICLCLGAGLFYTIMTRLVQVRQLKEMVRLLFDSSKSADGVSSFQALAMSLAGRVGVGNIAGVAAAIGFGGPGAVFWMWVTASLGAATAYAESTLAQIYKEKDITTGEYRGGPAYYFEKGMGKKWFGVVFAIASLIACGVFLPGVQANGVVNAATQIIGDGTVVFSMGNVDIGAYRLAVIVGVMTLLGVIIFGGVHRIAKFAEIVVPFMAIGYIVIALLVMIMNIGQMPVVFGMILGDAFSAQAGLGAAIGWGVKRGIYSNEAGQGTGPHAAAAAEVQHPAQQGLVQAFSVYVDTLLVCSATAFMILTMGTYNIQGSLKDGEFLVQNVAATTTIYSPAFTQMALEASFGSFGPIFVAVSVFFFAFTTIMAYYYIAEINISYLMRTLGKNAHKNGMFMVKVIIIATVGYGGMNSAGYIWDLGDLGVGLMAWLNIIGILVMFFVLGKPTLKTLRDYEQQKQAGVQNYSFDPVKLGIKGADFWEERLRNKHQ